MKLLGPFSQIVTMDQLPLKGPLSDNQLPLIVNGGILINNQEIVEVGEFSLLQQKAKNLNCEIVRLQGDLVAMPGLIDSHTHICWAGSRANDYAKRLAGKTYLEIANEGGGIWSTVLKTREASQDELSSITSERANTALANGVTTIEVKSGYTLSPDGELKMLRAIKQANTKADLISTCLAAHICPKDFEGSSFEYLDVLIDKLLPLIKTERLSNRIDIFVEDSAFEVEEAREYLNKCKDLGFDLVVHGDQFTAGGSQLAVELGALSVDHLEASNDEAIELIAKSNIVATVLPGASIGLGISFAPARKLLDKGACVSIASDWNPGSAPNGDLLMQASLLGVYEGLTIAETLAGCTCRAAAALNLADRGILKKGFLADIAVFPTNDFKEVIYRQGALKPSHVFKKGHKVNIGM